MDLYFDSTATYTSTTAEYPMGLNISGIFQKIPPWRNLMQKTEPIAENHITITRPLFYEGMRSMGKKSSQKGIKKLILLLIILYFLIAAWILYKALSQDSQTAPERTVRFYENSLTVTGNSCKTTDIAYSKITGWQESKHLYILECAENIRVLISKDGFTSGDFELVKAHFPSR